MYRVEPELHDATKIFDFAYKGLTFLLAKVKDFSAKLNQKVHIGEKYSKLTLLNSLK